MNSNSTDPSKDMVNKNATDYIDESVEISDPVSATNDPPKRRPKRLNSRQLKKESKIGRNDICHCGSGLKYKKCHLVEKQKQEQQQASVSQQVEEMIENGTK